MKKAE